MQLGSNVFHTRATMTESLGFFLVPIHIIAAKEIIKMRLSIMIWRKKNEKKNKITPLSIRLNLK